MKNKQWFLCALILMIIGLVGHVIHQRCLPDPYLQIAEEINGIENTLKAVDENAVCESISKVTPCSYTDSEGNTIVYYCCQTRYVPNESGKDVGLDLASIRMVVDLDWMENKRECWVNEFEAVHGKIGNRYYLCWTISPEMSCIIEYDADQTDFTDILHMAESVDWQKKRY